MPPFHGQLAASLASRLRTQHTHSTHYMQAARRAQATPSFGENNNSTFYAHMAAS